MKNTNDWYLWPMPFFEQHHNRLASGFSQWRCPAVGHDAVIEQPGNGFKIALSTFDIFRTSVGAAGLGMGRRAFAKTHKHTKSRSLFGATMTARLGVQTKLVEQLYRDIRPSRIYEGAPEVMKLVIARDLIS